MLLRCPPLLLEKIDSFGNSNQGVCYLLTRVIRCTSGYWVGQKELLESTPSTVAYALLHLLPWHAPSYKPLAYCVHVSSWQPLALHVGRFEPFHPRVSFLLYQEDRYLTKLEFESPASPWAELSCSEESLLISYSMVPSESGGGKELEYHSVTRV